MRAMPTGRTRCTSALPSGMTSWSRKQADRGCRPVTTSTSTDVPRSSPRGDGESSGSMTRIRPTLQKLPAGFSHRNELPEAQPVCPADAPVKSFNVVAMDYPSMKFNPKAPESIEVDFERKIQLTNAEAKIYALEEEASKVASEAQPMPLTLRVNTGDCIKVHLKNKMKESKASFSAISLAFDPKDSLGANVGNNTGDQTIAPGCRADLHLLCRSVPRRNHIVGVGLGQCHDESAQRAVRRGGRRRRRDPSIAIPRPAPISRIRTPGWRT